MKTSALSEELVYATPESSAHVAFRHYLEDAGVLYGKKRRRVRKKQTLTNDIEVEQPEASVADEMPIVIHLAQNDIANIQSSWVTIEPMLLKVRSFLAHKCLKYIQFVEIHCISTNFV